MKIKDRIMKTIIRLGMTVILSFISYVITAYTIDWIIKDTDISIGIAMAAFVVYLSLYDLLFFKILNKKNV